MKKAFLKVSAGFLVLFSIGFFAFKISDHGYKVGDVAKDFELKNIDGTTLSMGQIKYSSMKGFIVVFTCNHCPFSQKYESRIIDLNKKYEPLGYPVIAINPNDPEREPEDSFENMKARAKEKGYNFPYLVDENQQIAYSYGAQKTPHVYVLKKESGKLKVAYIGAIDDNVKNSADVKEKYVEMAVDELIAGKPVTKSSTKAIGCTIKWKQ